MTITFEELPIEIKQLSEDIAFIKQHILITKPVTDRDDVLTVLQTAKFLSLCPQTIYSLISKREIPFMKRGKRVYFSKDELIKYLKDGIKPTKYQIQNTANLFLSKINKKEVCYV